MAKRMTDEQKLFFGTKSQRAAVKRKHPSWAKDKSGFRQTIKGKRNPFMTKAKTKRKMTLLERAKRAVKSQRPGALTPALNAVLERDMRKSRGSGGSTSMANGDALFSKKNLELLGGLLAAPAVPGIGGLLGGSLSGGTVKSRGGKTLQVMTAGVIPGAIFSPQPERFDYDEIKASNLAWIDAHPGSDPYGLLDPQYAIA